VCLGELGLRIREKFSYEYNFFAGWHVDLRVEQIRPAEPGKGLSAVHGRTAGRPARRLGGP
jgi:hypothetical protein